jgi:hypothetical protein
MDAASGFWIFIASIVVAGMWKDSREKAEQHETLRRIVEKTGTIEEVKLKELFSKPPSQEINLGEGYRWARVSGSIILSVAAAMATFFMIAVILGKVVGLTGIFDNNTGLIAGLTVSAGVAILGLGIFFSSRFCKPAAGAIRR